MRSLSFCFTAAIVSISVLPLLESSADSIETRAIRKVRFFLYTKANPNEPDELLTNNMQSVRRSHFNNTRHTKILIHGWNASYMGPLNRKVRKAYFSQARRFNIIVVNWSPYSKLDYVSSVYYVPVVGEDVAEFVDFLHRKFKLNFNKLVVIGHSLGAHVAGICGKRVKEGKIAGIVGLDVAFPLYKDTEERLASTDAKYVKTIHTNGGFNGFLEPIGHASFYANWGRLQPGCELDEILSCSHGRSIYLYANAVRRYSFAPVYKCASFLEILVKYGCSVVDNYAKIGDPLQVPQVQGIFYFETNDQAPFGRPR